MADFYFTFGQKYHRETHPFFGEAHPDGWVRITAPNYNTARGMSEGIFGTQDGCVLFSMMYEEKDFKREYFPKGEIAHFTFNEAVNRRVMSDLTEHEQFMKLRDMALEKWEEVLKNRDEILSAFIAKYGLQPDEVAQVQNHGPHGLTWQLAKVKPHPPIENQSASNTDDDEEHQAFCRMIGRRLERFSTRELEAFYVYIYGNLEPTIAGLAQYVKERVKKGSNDEHSETQSDSEEEASRESQSETDQATR